MNSSVIQLGKNVTGFYSPPGGVQSTAIFVYVSLFLCLFTCIPKTDSPGFTKFSVHYLWPWLIPPLMTMQYLCTSSFVDVMFFTQWHKCSYRPWANYSP